MDAIDRQLQQILEVEAKHKGDNAVLMEFWENLWASGGLKFNGIHWTYRLVDLYVKAKRYDDAWRMLNQFVLSKPQYITNTRKWQIKVLKKEKKDYSQFQQLLENNR